MRRSSTCLGTFGLLGSNVEDHIMWKGVDPPSMPPRFWKYAREIPLAARRHEGGLPIRAGCAELRSACYMAITCAAVLGVLHGHHVCRCTRRATWPSRVPLRSACYMAITCAAALGVLHGHHVCLCARGATWPS